LLFCWIVAIQRAMAADSAEFFEKRVRPVLVERCYECHGEKKRRFTILAVKKNGGGSPRRGKGVNANPTPIPV
jgi:hypothetical protein